MPPKQSDEEMSGVSDSQPDTDQALDEMLAGGEPDAEPSHARLPKAAPSAAHKPKLETRGKVTGGKKALTKPSQAPHAQKAKLPHSVKGKTNVDPKGTANADPKAPGDTDGKAKNPKAPATRPEVPKGIIPQGAQGNIAEVPITPKVAEQRVPQTPKVPGNTTPLHIQAMNPVWPLPPRGPPPATPGAVPIMHPVNIQIWQLELPPWAQICWECHRPHPAYSRPCRAGVARNSRPRAGRGAAPKVRKGRGVLAHRGKQATSCTHRTHLPHEGRAG